MSEAIKATTVDPAIQELLVQVKRRLDAMAVRAVQRFGEGALVSEPPRTPLGDMLRSIAATIDTLEAMSSKAKRG
jgi:hypothetical protein